MKNIIPLIAAVSAASVTIARAGIIGHFNWVMGYMVCSCRSDVSILGLPF